MKLVLNGVGLTLVLLASFPALAGVIQANSASSQQLFQSRVVYNGKNFEDGEDLGELAYVRHQTIAATPATITISLPALNADAISLVQMPAWSGSRDVTLMSWHYRQIDTTVNSLQQAAAAVTCSLLTLSSYSCPLWTMQPWRGFMARHSAASFYGGGPYHKTSLSLETQGSSEWFDTTTQQLQTFSLRQQLYFETASIPDWGIKLQTPSLAELFAWLPTTRNVYFFETQAKRYQCDNANMPRHQCKLLESEDIYLTNQQLTLQLSAVPAPAPISALVIALGGLCWWRRRAVAVRADS